MNTLIFLLVLLCQSTGNQLDSDSIMQVGGLNRNEPIPPRKVDTAILRTWYEFTQMVNFDGVLLTASDTMVLVIGSNHSLYYDWNREEKYKNMIGQLDAAKKTTKEIIYKSINTFSELAVDHQRLSEFTPNRDNSEILKDRENHIIITTDMDDADILHEQFYLLEENIPSQNWYLSEDTLTVLGYTCYKATCNFRGRDYIAWFAPDIPLHDGPFKFYGLPGLILLLEDTENLFQFRAIGLEQLSNVEIVSESKNNFIKCTPEQYTRIKKKIRETLFLYYSRGISLYVTKRRLPIDYIPLAVEF